MSFSALLGAMASLGWLLPNHYSPWVSAWQDGVSLFLVAAAGVASQKWSRVPITWAAWTATAIAAVVLQACTGTIHHRGDAFVGTYYLAALLLAVPLGRTCKPVAPAAKFGADAVTSAATITFGVAILSVGIAAVQWTGTMALGTCGAEIPPGSRPFANVAQPNHFSTICFLGLCALCHLHQAGRVGAAVWWLAAAWMVFGVVLGNSRTGLLQCAWLVVFVAAMKGRATVALPRRHLLLLGALLTTAVLSWPWINDALMLSGGRPLDEQAKPGLRLLHWQALADAAARRPWFGYGWQQVSAAQQETALDHPYTGEYLEHSHNLILDLVLWNGIPIGLALAGLIAYWFIRQIRHCRDARAVWLLAGIGGLLIHSLLEFPLEYAYFLIPFGLMVGAVSSIVNVDRTVQIPANAIRATGLVMLVALGFIAREYLIAEENYRMLRLESAHIGTDRLVTPAPDLKILTQLQAFLEFARIEATPGMSPQQLDRMRQVSERFGYAPVMFRYALAAGLNGQPDVATKTLARLCRIQAVERCVEGRDAWGVLQKKYPQLSAIAAPDLPVLPR